MVERKRRVPEPLSTAVGARMSRTRGRDTAPELALRSELHARGLRFRVDLAPIPGLRRRADVVFTRARVAVFVDGCFFHGCPDHATWPKHNADFWRNKIETNRRRDRDTDRRFADDGWVVVRVWEHEDLARAAEQIEEVVRRRANSGPRLGGPADLAHPVAVLGDRFKEPARET